MLFQVLNQNNKSCGYYFSEHMAQEHADWLNEWYPDSSGQNRKARVIRIAQENDKKEKGGDTDGTR